MDLLLNPALMEVDSGVGSGIWYYVKKERWDWIGLSFGVESGVDISIHSFPPLVWLLCWFFS